MIVVFSNFWLLLKDSHYKISVILGPFCSFLYVVDQVCHYFEIIFSKKAEFSCNFLIPNLLDSFSTSLFLSRLHVFPLQVRRLGFMFH